MLQRLFNENVFIYLLLGLGALGILVNFILAIIYFRLIKASYSVATAKNKFMKALKTQFEACYKLNIGVNNVENFVDKYIYKYKFCGIRLNSWTSLNKQLIAISIGTSIITAILGYIYNCNKKDILLTVSVGIISSCILIVLEIHFDLSMKKKLIAINLKEYFENYLKTRLEQEQVSKDIINNLKDDELLNEEFATTKQEKLKPEGVQERERTIEERFNRQKKLSNNRSKKDIKEEEKILEDILKEYLA